MAEAGWYPDPQDGTALRYYDGQRWTGDRRAGGNPIQPEPQWGTPPARRSRSRRKLTLAAAVVILVAAGLGGWKLLSSDDTPKLTYQGKQIAYPGKVLQAAETTVAADVARRHGAKNGDTRCYFTQPRKTPSGQQKSDIDGNLLCGPVLFVDGDGSKPYLSVPFQSSTSGGKATLTPAASLAATDNVRAPDTVRLVRPDGKGAPAGTGGLKAPQPPAADKDVLISAPLGQASPPPPIAGATIVGKNESVTLVSAGLVPRYGSGDDARSAPEGQQLLAFRITTADGDLGAPPASGGLTVSVTGGQARAVPAAADPEDYVVLAMPKSDTATLVLDDGGFKQTLSLPDGKPGAGNIAVLARRHRFVTVAKTANVPVRLSNGSGSANAEFRTTVTSASLDFWVARHPDQHPASVENALLSVDLTYTDPSAPGTFGWDPQLLKLRLPNGTVLSARNLATAGRIFDVFEVPAAFTGGTVQITGTEKVQGITLDVSKVTSFAVSIPAG